MSERRRPYGFEGGKAPSMVIGMCFLGIGLGGGGGWASGRWRSDGGAGQS